MNRKTPGLVTCPECGGGKFYLEHWDDHVSVVCKSCLYIMRELDISWFSEYPVWHG